jgi:hypothetical protein
VTWLIAIFWLAVACVWITIACLAIGAAIGLYLFGRSVWRGYIEWRNDRQLIDEARMRAGFKTLRAHGWEDVQ